MSFAIRAVLLPGLGFAGVILYGQVLRYLGAVIVTTDRSLIYGSLLLQGFVSAALVAAVLCFPLAKMFRQYSPYAALAISLPVLVLRIPELLDPSRHVIAWVMSAYDVLAYACLLVIGTWLAHKQLSAGGTLGGYAAQAARP